MTYEVDVNFDRAALCLSSNSWIWTMLEDLAAESKVAHVLIQAVQSLKSAIQYLAADSYALEILARAPEHVRAEDIRRLFQRSEEIALDKTKSSRARSTFRSFVFKKAGVIHFAEPVDPQRVRFYPKIPHHRGSSRSLISDFNDITDPKASVPVGAISSSSALELLRSIRTRAHYDLQKIRAACIAEMTCAAEVRARAKELRMLPVSSESESIVRRFVEFKKSGLRFPKSLEINHIELLSALLKSIEKNALAANSTCYGVPFSWKLRQILFEERPIFHSRKIFEIEQRACLEEIFAAFHLLHTYVGWNWSSVMGLTLDQLDLTRDGYIAMQGYKSKSDDETPYVSIDINEPGVEMAVNVLIWNRKRLVELGYIDRNNMALWVASPAGRGGSDQAPYVFHPSQRLQDFISRHGLPKYSFDQIRAQYLFHLSLTKGGVESARLYGGHVRYETTERYVGNVIQDRISSALNLEFSKRLEKEIIYLYDGGSRNDARIVLLRPIGDGSSCIDPMHPPHGRILAGDECEAKACHTEGGCPHRRIVIDDTRIEEVIRFYQHYKDTWQRSWHENPQRYVLHVLPGLSFNAALLMALRNGPYAAKVHQVESRLFYS